MRHEAVWSSPKRDARLFAVVVFDRIWDDREPLPDFGHPLFRDEKCSLRSYVDSFLHSTAPDAACHTLLERIMMTRLTVPIPMLGTT